MSKLFSVAAFIPSFALALAQSTNSAFPVDIQVLCPPTPVSADSAIRLLYEMRLTNFSSKKIELVGLRVLAQEGSTLASYRDTEIEPLMASVGPPEDAGKLRSIEPGRSVTIFLDLNLGDKKYAPAELGNAFSFSYAGKDGILIHADVNGPAVLVEHNARAIRPPLRGSGWVAVNGLANPDHRRAFNAVNGREHLAQRFAIDWIKLGPDNRFLNGDPKSNSSYYDYGADVLAIADGRVSALTDGITENAGDNPANARHVTLENITGNSIVLDLGDGRYALYAHLQPNSLRVKLGDRVKAGQLLARLGNSGNSDAPHLHFQLMDANSPLGAEGIPYALVSFTQLGVLNDPDVLDKGKTWQPEAGTAAMIHRMEFPVDNAIVAFP